MIDNATPLTILPNDFQANWQADLTPADDHPNGAFRLVGIRRTQPGTWEEMRIIALVVDENGIAIPGVKVAFSYSTAHQYIVGQDFTWRPPAPRRADIVPTEGSGQIEHIQGSVVNAGEPGGVTVYCIEPQYASDVVTGLGALPDHTGVHLTFMLKRVGVLSIDERLANVESRLDALKRG